MFSRIRNAFSKTAAWRLSLAPTLTFAVGSTIAFVFMYFIAARTIHEYNDAWLNGEVEVLRQVSFATPQGGLYPQIIEDIAESAAREVSVDTRAHAPEPKIVFFLYTDPTGRDAVWVGPNPKKRFIAALHKAQLDLGGPQSLHVSGWKTPFRVIRDRGPNGSEIYLGLSDLHARQVMETLMRYLALIWLAVVAFGWIVSFQGARRTLKRVEEITGAVARIRSDALTSRIPEGRHSDEIACLARTFNGMLEQVADSVSQLRSLTESVAHELKSPVTSIRGRLEVALLTDEPDGSRDAVALALEELDRLSEFVTMTLDVAEAEGGALRIRREPLNLARLVSDLVTLYEPAFSERNQRIEAHLPNELMVKADVALVGRALTNLFDNELRHAGMGSRVQVMMAVGADWVTLDIEDNGPGFPDELLTRVFNRFAKGANSSGHGLGLAFVSSIVRAHGGTVLAGNRPAGGAFVEVALPVAK
jgi:signal transduction histidine kinase